MLLPLLLVGCGGGGPAPNYGEAPSAAANATESPATGAAVGEGPAGIPRPQTTPRPPAGVGTEGPTVVITGRVMEVSADARTITFDEQVHGFTGVSLAEGTEIVLADGSPATPRDLRPGAVVQASGRSGGSGIVQATRVIIMAGSAAAPR